MSRSQKQTSLTGASARSPNSQHLLLFLQYARVAALPVLLTCAAPTALGLTNNVGQRPIMGWSSWYSLAYSATETNIYEIARMIATNGMREAGYQYLEISDGWWARGYRENNMLVGNIKFPNGISNLVWKIHQLDLKATFYCLAGPRGSNYCDGIQGTETDVANAIARMGFDAVKFDLSCGGGSLSNAMPFYLALLATGSNIVINSGTGHFQSWYPEWLNTARIYIDIDILCGQAGCWDGILATADALSEYSSLVHPGYFNDADYLQLGITWAPNTLTTDEKKSHFALWCILAAPLLASCTGYVEPNDVSIMCSPELIAIDQDAAGHGGFKVSSANDLEVWKKGLGDSGATNAVLLLNRSAQTNDITVWFTNLLMAASNVAVRDCWARRDLGAFDNSYTARDVPPHGNMTLVMGAPLGAPVVAMQPLSQTNATGSTASFTCLVAGRPPLSYQWHFNGAPLPDATSSIYSWTNVQRPDAGDYSVVVTNSLGSVTSAVATLTVVFPPEILIQPQDQIVSAGVSTQISMVAEANPPPTYQWLFNGAPIPGATAAVLSLVSPQSKDAGIYSVLVSNYLGSILSSNAVLTVNGPPSIINQPQDAAIFLGSPVSFTVTAVGIGPLSYQWRKDDANLTDGPTVSGATAPTLSLTSPQLADLGAYIVSVSNRYGAVLSNPAILSELPAPTILSQPLSLTNVSGTIATFNVTATGADLHYQWTRDGTNLFDGGNISGAATDTLTLNNVTSADAAVYRVVITNPAGSVTSAPATLSLVFPFPWREPFDYPAGVSLSNQVTPNYLVWTVTGTSNPGPLISVGPGNLDIDGLAPGYGNSIRLSAGGKTGRLSFPDEFLAGTLYYSFLFKVLDLAGATPAGSVIAGFDTTTDSQTSQPAALASALCLRAAGLGFNLGTAKNSSSASDWIWQDTIYYPNQTLFVVATYAFNAAGDTNDDVAQLWINPDPASFGASTPPPPALIASGGPDIAPQKISSFVLLQNDPTVGPALVQADELRFDSSWAGVTPRPVDLQITNATLLSGGCFYLQGCGNPGHFALQASSNLVDWAELQTTSSPSGVFGLSNCSSDPFRFFRVRFFP